jgi:hypothetical protein
MSAHSERMTETQPSRPGIGFWLAIAASAIAGALTMARRPGFEPGDLVIPVAFAMIASGVVITLQEFGPPTLRDLALNQRFLIAFTVVLVALLLIWGIVTVR